VNGQAGVMARALRVEYEDASYHVMARGNERKTLFHQESDYQLFMQCLEEACLEFSLSLKAYCLMPNHYHLLLQTPQANLSRALGWLQTTFTVRYNRQHKRSGHLFQGRYKAHLIDSDAYARVLIPYIHLNPVRSRKGGKLHVTGTWSQLQAWKWSSHRVYTGGQSQPEWLKLDWLEYWGGTAVRAKKTYIQEMKSCLGEELRDPFEELREGLVLGGDFLWKKAQKLLSQKGGKDEERLKKRLSKSGRALRLRKLYEKEADPRWKIWVRARMGGERKVDLAAEYGYHSGAAILEVLKRLEKKAEVDPVWGKKMRLIKKTLSIES
jgi:putative transposase